MTRYSDHGVIAIDNTLIDRDGLLIPDAGWSRDHAEERNKIAQDYLFANYVCTSGKHYPLEFRLFRKQEICEALKQPFRNHTVLCCELIDWVCERNIPGDFTIDCYFTSAEVLNHIHGKTDRFGRPRGYVGDLKTNRNLEWQGRIIKASDLAASIPPGVIALVPGIMRLFWAFSPSNPPESPSQEESSLANMPDTLEARCRSDGPPAGPRSIDPLPGSRSFLTVSAVA